MALVRDPAFWRRFSLAVRLDEEVKSPTENPESINIWSDNWIKNQRRKQRKSVWCGCAICLLAVIAITALVVVIWWLWSHDWLREKD